MKSKLFLQKRCGGIAQRGHTCGALSASLRVYPLAAPLMNQPQSENNRPTPENHKPTGSEDFLFVYNFFPPF